MPVGEIPELDQGLTNSKSPSAGDSDESLYRLWCDAPTSAEGRADWERLHARHRSNLIAYCQVFTRDWQTAEDAAEEAFIRLMTPRPLRFSFRAYLWRVARNVALDLVRRPERALPEDLPSSPDDDPADQMATVESISAVDKCLEELAPEVREFVILRACEGLTLEEARNVVGWKRALSTCKSIYDRILGALRRCLQKI